MARVRGRGNKTTELALVSIFRRHYIKGWRRHIRLFGNPDFVFPKQKVTVFVDGCFWHGCRKHATRPATNRTFWDKKLARNKTRDHLVNRILKQSGWRVFRIWQHELRRKNEGRLVTRIKSAFMSVQRRVDKQNRQ